MTQHPQPPDSGQPDTRAELAFVQQALHAADQAERKFRISVAILCVLTLVAFVWMHLHLHAPQSLGDLLHMLLRISVVLILLLLAVMEYLRQAMNQNTRVILRALANTRLR